MRQRESSKRMWTETERAREKEKRARNEILTQLWWWVDTNNVSIDCFTTRESAKKKQKRHRYRKRRTDLMTRTHYGPEIGRCILLLWRNAADTLNWLVFKTTTNRRRRTIEMKNVNYCQSVFVLFPSALLFLSSFFCRFRTKNWGEKTNVSTLRVSISSWSLTELYNVGGKKWRNKGSQSTKREWAN